MAVLDTFFSFSHGIWNLSFRTRDRNHDPVLEGSSLNQRTTREVLDAHLRGSQLADTGRKKSWVPESERGGQQEPRSLRAVKAPCTAGSGQGVVTEMANVNQYPAALKRMKRLWARVEPERSLDSRVLML